MAKKVTVNQYNMVPVKVLSENFSNAYKGDILGVSPVDFVKLSAEGKVERVDFPKGTVTSDVYVEGGEVVAGPAKDAEPVKEPAGGENKPAA